MTRSEYNVLQCCLPREDLIKLEKAIEDGRVTITDSNGLEGTSADPSYANAPSSGCEPTAGVHEQYVSLPYPNTVNFTLKSGVEFQLELLVEQLRVTQQHLLAVGMCLATMTQQLPYLARYEGGTKVAAKMADDLEHALGEVFGGENKAGETETKEQEQKEQE